MTLPTYIPLDEAAQRTGWTVERLRAMVETGTIMAGKLPDGDIIVAMDEGKIIETPAPVETPAEQPAVAETEETRPSEERALPLAVAGDDINAQLAAIRREDFEHLRGQAITVSEATKKYGVPGTTIRGWITAGYVHLIDAGSYPKKIDESDMAYCATIYEVRKQYRSRAPLLKDDGSPYLLLHPDLAKARRIVRDKK